MKRLTGKKYIFIISNLFKVIYHFNIYLEVTKTDDSDDDAHYAEYLSSLIEIGPPKILRFQKKKQTLGSRTSRTTNNVSASQTEEMPEFLSEFFTKEIKDYLLGGLKCEFCQYNTLPWPTLINDSNNNKVKCVVFFFF